MVQTKTFIFTYFYEQYVVLFTMVPRNTRMGNWHHLLLIVEIWSDWLATRYILMGQDFGCLRLIVCLGSGLGL